ncbi:hypothetical protein Bhyg_01102 [Pseudolycoriella hygida]|uniref:Uncharacterized protein n=1 Tax=Pseudolycoriella hygida TaxID=35572 RepID=A0A9Q0S6I5_9DIPT|nr:hypothetical protein Bhyg_01102 [Pseudolycoriella hygida]
MKIKRFIIDINDFKAVATARRAASKYGQIYFFIYTSELPAYWKGALSNRMHMMTSGSYADLTCS